MRQDLQPLSHPIKNKASYKVLVLICLLSFIITDFSGIALSQEPFQKAQNTFNNQQSTDVFAPDQVTTQRMAAPPPEIEKIKWWKRGFKKKEPPVDEEAIVDVGPREYPITPGPLLRLSQPLLVNDMNNSKKETVLPPGFYLARYQRVEDHSQMMYLYHGRTLLAKIPLFSIADQAAGPVELIDEESAPLEAVQAVLIENNGKALITFYQGKNRYQSQPISVQTDPRPQLSY